MPRFYTFKIVLVVGLSIGVTFFMLEGLVRVYSLLFYPKMMVLDDRLGWKHARNVEKTYVNEYGKEILVRQNAYGHRGMAGELKKNAETFRILVLGDSFTEAIQVNAKDLFTTYLENAIPGVETMNAGVGGYGTVQEFLYLRDEGIKFSPDFVLLMVFENDFTENCLSYYPAFGPRPYAVSHNEEIFLMENLNPREYIKFTMPFPFRFELSRYSYLFYFLNTEVYQRLRSQQMIAYLKEDEKTIEACGKYQVFQKMIERMSVLVEERGTPFALVLIPSRKVIEEGSEDIYGPIEQFCQEKNFRCLFLRDRFQKEAKSGLKLFFPVDIHWTEDGHRIAGEEISKYLISLGGSMMGK